MQRRHIVWKVAQANIRATAEQQRHAIEPVAPGRPAQRGLLFETSAAGIDQVRAGVEQRGELVGTSLSGGVQDRADGLLLRRRPCVAGLHVADE